MTQANINAQTRTLATAIENFVTVTKDGAIADADLVSKALPEGLSQEHVDAVLNFVTDLPEAFDVVVAEKSIALAKEDAEVKNIKGSFNFNARVKYATKWNRAETGEDGTITRAGSVVGKLSVQSSEHHKENLAALEALAAGI